MGPSPGLVLDADARRRLWQAYQVILDCARRAENEVPVRQRVLYESPRGSVEKGSQTGAIANSAAMGEVEGANGK